MHCYTLTKITLGYLLTALFFIFPVIAQSDLPPILDYYPNCSYKVIENYTARIKTKQPKIEQTTLALLTKLRKKAQSVGANAIIIVNKKINKTTNSKKYYGKSSTTVENYTVSYQAELIEQCQTNTVNSHKLTPFNHQGNKVVKISSSTTTIERTFVYTPPAKAKLNHPIITNKELSTVNGIYGVKIGANYKHVMDKFGDPSFVLSMFEGEVIVGYGRKHWFHFQKDKLVKVQNSLSIVSSTLLNMVPLRDFFDDSPWLVANNLVRKSSFAEVKSALAADLTMNNQNEVVIKGKENSLTLSFSYRKETKDNDRNYVLDGFSLASNLYQESLLQEVNPRVAQFDTLGLVMSDLSQGKTVDLKLLSEDLGNPLGRITVSATSYIDMYNSNLLVEVKRSELASIQLLEELFTTKGELTAINIPWSLGDFVQEKQGNNCSSSFQKIPMS